MNSVQENKNELEAAVRYCESAISRAQATIESMEFRQQAASKAWHEQTGREESLLKKLEVMTDKYDRMKGYADKLLDEQGTMEAELEELRGIIDRMGDDSTGDSVTIKQLRDELDELSKAYKDSTHEEVTMKKAWREQRELVALRDDQIAMLERRLAKYTGEKVYPFNEGDIYYVFDQIDGSWISSVWDSESERIHDARSLPDHPHKVYFTVDQKNVLDKFKPEEL